MKIELTGFISETRENCQRFEPNKNRLKIFGEADSGIFDGGCFGDFELPVSKSFLDGLKIDFKNPPKIKITIEAL